MKNLPVILLVSFFMYIYSDDIGSMFHLDFITKNILFFFMGCFFYKYHFFFKRNLTAKSFVFFSIVFFLSEYFFLGDDYTSLSFYTAFIAMLGIIWVSNLSVLLCKVNIGWLESIGRLSLVIYLVHILSASGTRIIMTKLLHIDSWLINIAMGTVLGILLPIILYRLSIFFNITYLFEFPARRTKK